MVVVVMTMVTACGEASAQRADDTLAPLVSSEALVAPVESMAPAVPVTDPRSQVVSDALSTPGYETMLATWAESDVWQRIAGRPVTVLAPSERAFQALPHELVANMQSAALIDRHVLIGVYRYDQLAAMTSVTTLDGEALLVRVGPDGVVYVDETPVQMPLAPSVTGADGQDVAVFGYGKVRFDLG